VITIASSLGAGAPEDSTWCCPYLAPRLTKGGQPYLARQPIIRSPFARLSSQPLTAFTSRLCRAFLLSFGLID